MEGIEISSGAADTLLLVALVGESRHCPLADLIALKPGQRRHRREEEPANALVVSIRSVMLTRSAAGPLRLRLVRREPLRREVP